MKLCVYKISSCFQCHFFKNKEKKILSKSGNIVLHSYNSYYCKKARRTITYSTDPSRNSFCPLPDAPARIKKGSKDDSK